MPKITASARQARAHEREARRLRTDLADARRECDLLRAALEESEARIRALTAAANKTEAFVDVLLADLASMTENEEKARTELTRLGTTLLRDATPQPTPSAPKPGSAVIYPFKKAPVFYSSPSAFLGESLN